MTEQQRENLEQYRAFLDGQLRDVLRHYPKMWLEMGISEQFTRGVNQDSLVGYELTGKFASLVGWVVRCFDVVEEDRIADGDVCYFKVSERLFGWGVCNVFSSLVNEGCSLDEAITNIDRLLNAGTTSCLTEKKLEVQ